MTHHVFKVVVLYMQTDASIWYLCLKVTNSLMRVLSQACGLPSVNQKGVYQVTNKVKQLIDMDQMPLRLV